MHIIKFNHRYVPKPHGSVHAAADQAARGAEPALYGYRNGVLQFIFAAMFTLLGVGGVQAAAPLKIIAFGDSLTAGYKLPADEALPVVLEKALRAKGVDVTLMNAGVSGDTAEDGLARFDWTFAEGADGAIVELGANDMLRGFDTKQISITLDEILTRLKQRKIPFMLVGVKAMPNLGPEYAEAFDGIYQDLAHKYDVPLYPFILEGVMNNPPLQLADHLHPNREGVELIVQKMLPTVESFVKSLRR